MIQTPRFVDLAPPFARLESSGDLPPWKRIFMPRYEGAELVAVRQGLWSGVNVCIKDVRGGGAPAKVDFRSDCARLLVMLDEVGRPTESRPHPSRSVPFPKDIVHQMTFAPAHCPIWGYSEHLVYMRYMTFTFEERVLAELSEERDEAVSLSMPQFMFYDPALFHLAKLFEIEFESGEPIDTLYGDSLGVALLRRLTRPKRSARATKAPGGLGAHQLRMITEYLSAHLAERIHLRELAAITHLSRWHFSRAFKASTGMGAHQWLLAERVRKVKDHLGENRLSIADIATLTGFADQAHLTRVFHRVTGVSPGAWRRRGIPAKR